MALGVWPHCPTLNTSLSLVSHEADLHRVSVLRSAPRWGALIPQYHSSSPSWWIYKDATSLLHAGNLELPTTTVFLWDKFWREINWHFQSCRFWEIRPPIIYCLHCMPASAANDLNARSSLSVTSDVSADPTSAIVDRWRADITEETRRGFCRHITKPVSPMMRLVRRMNARWPYAPLHNAELCLHKAVLIHSVRSVAEESIFYLRCVLRRGIGVRDGNFQWLYSIFNTILRRFKT